MKQLSYWDNYNVSGVIGLFIIISDIPVNEDSSTSKFIIYPSERGRSIPSTMRKEPGCTLKISPTNISVILIEV